MYQKLIGSLLLVSVTTGLGFIKAENLKDRVKLLEELKRMTMLLQGELRFHRSVLMEIFENVSERLNEPLSGFLKEVSENMDFEKRGNFEDIWSSASENFIKKHPFSKEDRQVFILLGNSLGYLDITMQMECLNHALLQIEEHITQAKEQLQMKGKLYQTMGVSIGMLLVLLIV